MFSCVCLCCRRRRGEKEQQIFYLFIFFLFGGPLGEVGEFFYFFALFLGDEVESVVDHLGLLSQVSHARFFNVKHSGVGYWRVLWAIMSR